MTVAENGVGEEAGDGGVGCGHERVGGHGLAHWDTPQEYLERGLPALRSR
ncbi:hypothetical protein [Streptomyces mirabilis]